MNGFVRSIFVLLIGASAIGLGIVLVADMRGERDQAENMRKEKASFGEMVSHYNGHLRRGEIAVEWQKVDASQQVMETSLLVRIYAIGEDGSEVPLPVERVVIPHNRVSVDGLMLDFDVIFSDKYPELRNTELVYFDHIYADEQPLDGRFALLEPYKVPRATQIHSDRVTHYELELWSYLWDTIGGATDIPTNGKVVSKEGLTARWTEPATALVENGSVYAISIGRSGVHIEEDTDPSIRGNILREAARMDAEAKETLGK
jgi:hypothetical protein